MNDGSVQEISHRVRVDLPGRPAIKTPGGSRRKLYGLRIDYGIRRDVSRVDIDLVFHNSAEHFPPDADMPGWMQTIVEENRPADVDNPLPDRRTGMGGWDVPVPVVPEDPITGFHDPAALHAIVVRGLRALGFGPEDAERYAAAHPQDAFDRGRAKLAKEGKR
jgi:hypothetical protein